MSENKNIVRTLLIGTIRKDSGTMGMAEYKGKVNNIQDTPFGYTLSVIGGKWQMENGYYVPPGRKPAGSL